MSVSGLVRSNVSAARILLCGTMLAAILPAVSALSDEQRDGRGCADDADYQLLDFWLGEWVVVAGGEEVGVNRIEKILGGCAVLEHWESHGGGKGKSLFFVDDNRHWQQVWVTDRATEPGGVKQKTHDVAVASPAVRFRGTIRHPERGDYLDRTTLTPLGNGDVRQLIEISTDDGESWRVTFDAVYRRRPADRD